MVPPRRVLDALRVREHDIHREQIWRGRVDRHRRCHRTEVDIGEENIDISEGVHGDARAPNLTERQRIVGIPAHECRHVERGRDHSRHSRAVDGTANSCLRRFRTRRTVASSIASSDTSTRRPRCKATGPETRRCPVRRPRQPRCRTASQFRSPERAAPRTRRATLSFRPHRDNSVVGIRLSLFPRRADNGFSGRGGALPIVRATRKLTAH